MADNVEFTENAVTARRLAAVVEGVWGKVCEVTDALNADLGTKAPIDSPALTGTPTAPTAADGTNNEQIATTQFVQTAVTQGMAAADALTYEGTIAGGSTGEYGALTPAASKGYVYKVSAAGKIDGASVEVGDMLICNTDDTVAATADNYSTIAANWDIIQGNTDGVVVGPASSTDSHIALFNGATGKLIKDSGKTLADFATADHVHGNISNDGKIGSDADLSVVTTTGGEVTTANLTTANPTEVLGSTLTFIDSVSQDSKGKITATRRSVDKVKIVPTPDAADKLLASGENGAYDWQQLVKSTWGIEITDGTNPIVDENGDHIMDETATDLWTTFKGAGFGAERAAADVAGNPIMETYATKDEVSSGISDLDAVVTSDDGTNVQVKVTETDGKITAVNITKDDTVPTARTVNGHALSSDVEVTAADIKAVRYDTNNQGLSDAQKSNARTNIGVIEMTSQEVTAIVNLCN